MRNIGQADIPEFDNIEYEDFKTSMIGEYYSKVVEKYSAGPWFCGDCHFLNDDGKCKKGKRPAKVGLRFGPHEYAIAHKSCMLFEPRSMELDEDAIGHRVSNALNCSVQQYSR